MAMTCRLIRAGALGGVALLATAQAGWAQDDDEDEIPFAEANLFIELNDTDGDLGLQALIDGEPYAELEIEDPREREILGVRARGPLGEQGLTELFFESAEPSFDELDPELFFDRFPEGIYEIEARTLDGIELESEVELSHVLPAPVTNIVVNGTTILPVDPGDPDEVVCDLEELPVVEVGDDPVVISWDPVTTPHPEIGRQDLPIEIVGYQLVVEREPTDPEDAEDAEDPEDLLLLVFSVDLPPSVTELQVPPGFIALGDEFKVEVVARGLVPSDDEDVTPSENRTAVESCFAVAEAE